MAPSEQSPIIIAGAGIVGLALAQALKKEKIPFLVYERDQHFHTRSAGWGISIYWALPGLENCLPSGLSEELLSVQVDPQQKITEKGSVFLDLETAEPRFVIPSSFRRRISRVKLRNLLATGIDVNWDKSISGFQPTVDGIMVSFTDGTKVHGSALAAADGSGSKTRRLLMGDELGRLNPLCAHYLAVTLCLTPESVDPLRKIDPVLFQGSHPGTGAYLWYSALSTPEVNGSIETVNPYYEVQLHVSWLVKGPEESVPETNAEKISKIKSLASAGTGFEKALRDIIENIPEDTEVTDITLADWPTVPWNGLDGRVTLLGDAAHPMTMYRGEAANHEFTDVTNLVKQLKLWHQSKKTRQAAMAEYEGEMIRRGHQAVLLSRQACLDAHDIRNLGPESPLLNRGQSKVASNLEV